MEKGNIEKKYKLVDLEGDNLIREKDTIENLEIIKISAEGKTSIKNGEKIKVITRVILETTDKEKKRITFKPKIYKKVVTDLWGFEFSEGEISKEVTFDELPIQFIEISKKLKEGETVNVKIPVTTYKKITDKGEKRYYTITKNRLEEFILI